MNTQTTITPIGRVCAALPGLDNKVCAKISVGKSFTQLSTCTAISIPDQACSHASVFSPVKHFINILTCDMRRSLSGKLFGGMSQAR